MLSNLCSTPVNNSVVGGLSLRISSELDISRYTGRNRHYWHTLSLLLAYLEITPDLHFDSQRNSIRALDPSHDSLGKL